MEGQNGLITNTRVDGDTKKENNEINPSLNEDSKHENDDIAGPSRNRNSISERKRVYTWGTTVELPLILIMFAVAISGFGAVVTGVREKLCLRNLRWKKITASQIPVLTEMQTNGVIDLGDSEDSRERSDDIGVAIVNGDTMKTRKTIYSWGTTIEIPIVTVMCAVAISDSPITNMIMYRSCVHSLEFPDETCRSFLDPGRSNGTTEIEVPVQEYATLIITVKAVLEALLPAVLSLFMVVWSDTHGRKPLMVWPILGLTLTGMLVVGYSMVESLGPWWFLATCIPYSLSGGYAIMGTAALCYVTDVTNEEKRAFRLMVVEAMIAFGMASGTWASPYLLGAVGNDYLLLVVAALSAIAYVYTVFVIKESILSAEPGSLLSVLDFGLVKELFRECFKRRQNNLRAHILLVTTVISLEVFTTYGVGGLGYLFTREVLQWSLHDFTLYSSVSTAITFVGSFLGISVVQRLFSIGDLPFAILAVASSAVMNFIKAFASAGWQMYLGSSIALFGTLISPLTRSFVSKILPPEDIAKVFALICAIEGVCPLLAPVIYNALYAKSLATFPGIIFILTAAINITNVTLLGFSAYFVWRNLSKSPQTDKSAVPLTQTQSN